MKTKLFRGLMGGMCALVAIGFQPAQAVIVSAGTFNDPNDCAGFFSDPFGNGFDACQIFSYTDPNDVTTIIALSPVIAKFDTDGNNQLDPNQTANDINTTDYPSVAGDEWTFDCTTGATTDCTTGTWTYTPDSNDPGIKYWVAKSANDFVLFWDVDQSVIDAGTCVNSTTNYTQTNFNYDCLVAANVVEGGTWETTISNSGGLNGLSHITFYDTEPISTTTSSGGGEQQVPEPGILALLGLGLLSGLVTRRRFGKQG